MFVAWVRELDMDMGPQLWNHGGMHSSGVLFCENIPLNAATKN